MKYSLPGKVAILESKETVLNAFGLKSEQWLNVWDIDSRLLTVFYRSLDPVYQWFIVVYDYQTFCLDIEMKEAIIWHEIGHIAHPVHVGDANLDSEIRCDDLAIERGYKDGLKRVLDLTLKMAKTLNNELLANITSERQTRLAL
ncbi:hypothetical protein [Bacillus sp. T33-2]|uniref:hypothetical protein n=1 Tax=Bacillus sp. T33-2 TaxID=2054168 RepID=UPI0021557B8D|nr:hypothetical protein [Bacillus sp. T33-2]